MKKKLFVTLLTVVMVMLFIPVMAMPASAADGDAFVISGDAGYTYKDGVLTITQSGDYTVSMADGVAETDHVIVVDTNVTDVVLTLDGVVINTTKEKAFEVKSGATVTLSTINEGAQLQGANYGISNGGYGTLTISGETTNVTAEGGLWGISNTGTLTISGGKVEATTEGEQSMGIVNEGTLNITGGTVNATATAAGGRGISNDRNGTLTISGETTNVTAEGADYGIQNNGTLNIEGGTVDATATGNNGTGISNENGGALNITGGTVEATATGRYGIYNSGELTITGSANVTAEGSIYGISNSDTLTVSGGTLTTEDGIYNSGELTITGSANVTAKDNGSGIYNENGGALNITGGTVTAESANHGISNWGTLNIEGGTVNATATAAGGYGIYNNGTIQAGEGKVLAITDESGNAVVLDKLADYKKVTVTAVVPFIIDGGTLGEDYTYENGVLTFIKGGEYTVSMADGVAETDHIIVVGDAINAIEVNLKLDGVVIKTMETSAFTVMYGATVTLSGTATLQSEDYGFDNYGTLTISGTADVTVKGSYGIDNEGTLTVEGGTVKATATGEYDFGIYNYGTLTVKGGEVIVEGYIGIYNDGGTLTIAGGTVTAEGASCGISNLTDGTIQPGANMVLVIKDENGESATLADKNVTVTASYPLVVTGGTLGTDYTYENGVLTFINGGTYTVSMAPGLTETDHIIVVGDGSGTEIDINLKLDGVVIKTTKEYAFEVKSGATVTLSGTATLQGETYGIYNTGTLTITGGTVEAIAAPTVTGESGYGIENYGELMIEDGTVTATAKGDGNGIRNSGKLTIEDGTVTATTMGRYNGIQNSLGTLTVLGGKLEAIALGYTDYGIGNNGTLTIAGGEVKATATGDDSFGIRNTKNMTIEGSAKVTAEGKYYGIRNAGTLTISGGTMTAEGASYGIDNNGGTINPGANMVLVIKDENDNPITLDKLGEQKKVTVTASYPLVVTGGTLGTDYTYRGSYLIFIKGGTYTVSMADGVAETTYGIQIDNNVTGVNLILDSVNINTDSSVAFEVNSGATVTLSGTATLQGEDYGILSDGSLTVSGENTNVTATSARDSGIKSYGTLIIEDGTVTATSYNYGIYNTGGTLTVTGGTLKATATSQYGYGIYNYSDSLLKIEGGTVTATVLSEEEAYGIYNQGTLTISGGTVTVTVNGVSSRGIANQGTLTISGENTHVTVKSSNYGIRNSGTLNITGGMVTAEGASYGIDNHGTLTVTNVEIFSADGSIISVDDVKNHSKVTVTAPFVITGGTLDTDYTYTGGILTFIKDGTYTVSMAEGANETAHCIVIAGADINLTLDGVVIKTTSSYAFEVKSGTSVTLSTTENGATLQAATYGISNNGTLTVTGGTVKAVTTGEGVNGIRNDGTLTISGGKVEAVAQNVDSSGIYNTGALSISDTADVTAKGYIGIYNDGGELTVTGGTVTATTSRENGYGIFNNTGTLTITGGKVEVVATGDYGSGIYNTGTLTISGGEVTAEGEFFGIYNSGTLTISGGTVTAESKNFGIYNEGTLTVTNVEIFGADGSNISVDDINNHSKVTVTTPLVVAGGTLGTDYTYADGVLTFIKDGTYTVSMAEGANETAHCIVIAGADINLTLDGVNIKTTSSYAFEVMYGASVTLSGTATLQGATSGIFNNDTLTIEGENTNVFVKGEDGYGIYNFTGTLTIEGGVVRATASSENGLGIFNVGTLTVTGGTVTATATGEGGYGIVNVGTLTISGGKLTAEGETCSIFNEETGTLTIEGGVVRATASSENGYGIYNRGTLTITDGNVTITATGETSYGIYNPGTLNITGGAVNAEGETYGIYNEGTLNLSNVELFDADGSKILVDDIDDHSKVTITTPLVVTGGTLGTDYTYEDGILTFINGGTYTVSMAEGAKETAHCIVIAGADINLKLDGVVIKTDNRTAFEVNSGASVTLSTTDKGVKLEGAILGISNNGTLNVTGGTVTATATGESGSGIVNVGTLTVEGGKVNAKGEINDIYNVGTLTVTGGNLTAEGEICSILNEDTGTLAVEGGEVNAKGEINGIRNYGTLNITGGKVEIVATGEGSYGIDNEGTLNITGGAVRAVATDENGENIFNNNGNIVIESGIVFEGTSGNVYGTYTLAENFIVKEDEILSIPTGSALIVPAGITLTNNGKIELEKDANLDLQGTLAGSGTVNINGIQHIPDQNGDGELEADADGDGIFEDANGQKYVTAVTVEKLKAELEVAKDALEAAINENKTNLQEEVEKLNAALESAQAALEATDAANKEELVSKIETADATLDAAIKAVQKNLDDAITALKGGDGTTTETITSLKAAIDAAKAALEATDAASKAELEEKIEAADASLDAAIKAVQKNLDDAITALKGGDGTTTETITSLKAAIDAAKAALEVTDAASKAELEEKIDEADASLDAAIKAVQKNLDDLKAALEAKDSELAKADADNKAALEAKDAELKTFIIIVCVISGVAFCGCGALAVFYFIDKKKKI